MCSSHDIISLQEMAFYGFHGLKQEERDTGQHYHVNVDIYCDVRKAGESDDLADTIDYIECYEIAKKVVTENCFKLIESIAELIAKEILETYEIHGVDVSVKKLKPAIPGIIESVEVVVKRRAQK